MQEKEINYEPIERLVDHVFVLFVLIIGISTAFFGWVFLDMLEKHFVKRRRYEEWKAEKDRGRGRERMMKS